MLVDFLLLLFGAQDGQHVLEDAVDGRLVHAEGIHDGADAPDEDACIPEIAAVADVLHGLLLAGLLPERIHAIDFLVARAAGGEVGLDIAVARLGPVGLHAKRDDGIGLARELHALLHHTAELIVVHHDMVAGRHHHIGLRVVLLDAPADVGNAGSRVATTGLEQDVTDWNLGQLLVYDGRIFLVGHHPHILGVADSFETVERELDERAADAKHVDKLLGLLGSTHRPKAASHSTGHDNEMIIIVCHTVNE